MNHVWTRELKDRKHSSLLALWGVLVVFLATDWSRQEACRKIGNLLGDLAEASWCHTVGFLRTLGAEEPPPWEGCSQPGHLR